MKRCIALIFLTMTSCNNSLQDNRTYFLTNNNAKIWYIESNDRDSYNNGYTLWYFNNNNDFFRYSYNSKTKNLEFLDNGDKIDSNKFLLTEDDSISLNDSKLHILKISEDEVVLQDTNSDSSIASDAIVLKIFNIDNKIFNENSNQVLNRIDSLNSVLSKRLLE